MNFSLKKFLGGLALTVATWGVSAQTAMNVGNVPLWFERTGGADGSAAQFIAHGRETEFSIAPTGARFSLREANGRMATVNLEFVGGAVASQVSGEEEQSGKINYLIGNDPAGWRSGVATFGKVRLDDVYPGVDAIFYGNQQKLEYDLNLAAGVKPETMAIRFEGAEKVLLNAEGELVIAVGGRDVVQHRPVAYQMSGDGVRQELPAGYKILNADTVGFAVGNYDHGRPLVIDPTLGYSTFFGGNFGEYGFAIALDGANNIYIAGQTFSTTVSNSVIPFATPGAAFTNYSGGKFAGDAFVAEFDNTGSNLLYCTYLGGSLDDGAYALAVDSAGHAYVAGSTDSTNFPTKNALVNGTYSGTNIAGVLDPSLKIFPTDAFVAELAIGGSNLVYSTYLGGEAPESARGIAVDGDGDAFVAGITFSTNFPVTSDAYQPQLKCTNSYDVNANAFVAEIAPGGGSLKYSTYFGGTNYDIAFAVAYTNKFLYVAGMTYSTNFPWVQGLLGNQVLNNWTNSRVRANGSSDAFVSVFANNPSSGTNLSLLYSTFLGSSNNDVALGVTGDGVGDAYVVGWTTSTNFPNTISTTNVNLHSFVRTNGTGFIISTNSFLTKILYPAPILVGTNTSTTSTNAAIAYSQIFGGRGIDQANGVALDAAGDVFVVGTAQSTNFPTTDNLFGSLRTTNSSRVNSTTWLTDVVVTVFKADFSALLYSAYLGGSSYDYGSSIAVDGDGSAYITGATLSTNFPTVNPLRSVRDGTNDAFVSKITLNTQLPELFASRSGTNVQVFWQPLGSETLHLGLETVTNLLSTVVLTNIIVTPTGTNRIMVTNIDWRPVTNAWVTNGADIIYTLPRTNKVQFYQFRPN